MLLTLQFNNTRNTGTASFAFLALEDKKNT